MDGKTVRLQIWDTAGQERYRNITQNYFKDAQAVVLAYDCTSEESFNNVRSWMRQVDQYTNRRQNVECILIGNKADLSDEKLIQPE